MTPAERKKQKELERQRILAAHLSAGVFPMPEINSQPIVSTGEIARTTVNGRTAMEHLATIKRLGESLEYAKKYLLTMGFPESEHQEALSIVYSEDP